MQKILVTGGAGFIGSSLAEKLIEGPDNYVVIADNLITGKRKKLPGKDKKNWSFIKCDVNNYNDISSILVSHKFDYIFHYAAIVGVERTLANPIKVFEDIQGFENLLNLCKNTEVKRVLYASSSEVYGSSKEFPQHETETPLDARLPYAITKKVGESFLYAFHKEHNLDFTAFRFFNTYGPKQSTDFVISRFINAALNDDPITVYGDGSQTRTFCFIDDNVDACINAWKNNLYINEAINVGNDIEVSILDLAKMIISLTDSKSDIKFLPALSEGDMPRRKPHLDKMKNALNRNMTSLEKGLIKVIEERNF